MPNNDPRNPERLASEVAEHCPLSDEGRALLTSDLTPGKYVALLIAQEQFADAIRFTSFTLPKRDAIWWGTLCLWEAHRAAGAKTLPGAIDATFQTLIAWIQDPSETNRRTVETAGRDAGITTPHGQLAMAAFFSDGSMSLAGQPEVAPEPWLTAKNVASVVLAASKMGKPSAVEESQRLFLVLAAELTKGQLPWQLQDEAELVASAV